MFTLYFGYINAAQVSSPKLAQNQWSWGMHTSDEPQCRLQSSPMCLGCSIACHGHHSTNTCSRQTAAVFTYLYTSHDTWMLYPHSLFMCLPSPLRASCPPQPFPPSRLCLTHSLGCTGTLPIHHHSPCMERHPGRNLLLVSTRHEKGATTTALSHNTGWGWDPLVLPNPFREHQQQHTK